MHSIKYQCYKNIFQYQNRRNMATKALGMWLTDKRRADICIDLFDSILQDKAPAYKKEENEFLIINAPDETLRHPILDLDINSYVSEVLSSRSNPLFAVATGVGRGKTRMLVEMQRKFNENPNVFCLALTFKGDWLNILSLPNAPKLLVPEQFQYGVNIVARMISMNYRVSLREAELLLHPILEKIDSNSVYSSCLIHEFVKYIVRQYRAEGKVIDQFVLLLDESDAIQKALDPNDRVDMHKILRESLLTQPMIMDDGLPLKVDLVMSRYGKQ
jgi:hypothetical protein